MGIGKELHQFEEEITTLLRLNWKDVRMCELGDQEAKFLVPRIYAKQYYSEQLKVAEHISLDIHGEHGTRVVDLCKAIPVELVNHFDLVTNYGTLEHVSNQYQGFKNVHDMCKVGGIMIHALPLYGHWQEHGRYYYSETFVQQLAQICGYEIIKEIKIMHKENFPLHDQIMAAYRKTRGDFIGNAKFMKLPIADTHNNRMIGDYTRRKTRFNFIDRFILSRIVLLRKNMSRLACFENMRKAS